MANVQQWSGLHARALRQALRMSVRAFAEHLGVAVRTVSKWESLGAGTVPRPDTQAILDTALARCDPATHLRFEIQLSDHTTVQLTRVAGPRQWDYESWTDDIERAAAAFNGQNFAFAANLLDRWLTRYEPRGLDDTGLYLFARSTALSGDLLRDQGHIIGPLSAGHAYARARSVFGQLDIPRRIAQLDLSLAVVAEMSGRLAAAARSYEALAVDERLSRRDRARALLWVGTALSKTGDHAYATRVMTAATRDFDDLGEPEDWSVAHQKLALAHRGAGDLDAALRLITVARNTATTQSPLQRVRLDTAYGHILLSDPATAGTGLQVLARAAEVAGPYGMSHQLRSIEGIRQQYRPPSPGDHGRRPVTDDPQRSITDRQWADAQLIWDYHQMGHDMRACDAAIGLGSHDFGVPTYAAELYHAGRFPTLVFTGATNPTRPEQFPRGEAVHFREHALALGVPGTAILVEPTATNTGANITLSRDVLATAGVPTAAVMLIAMPYMQRRAYATCRKVWPEVDVVCASQPLAFADYVKTIGDEHLITNMLVGDLQRVIEYPRLGFAIEQAVPEDVHAAYQRLLTDGFTRRLLRV